MTMTINDKIIACDMKKVPLADEALDVAVFSFIFTEDAS
jgi:putative methyltransferase